MIECHADRELSPGELLRQRRHLDGVDGPHDVDVLRHNTAALRPRGTSDPAAGQPPARENQLVAATGTPKAGGALTIATATEAPNLDAHRSAAAQTAITVGPVYSRLLTFKTGAGVDLLANAIAQAAGWAGETEGLFMARGRHLEALARCRVHLNTAIEVLPETELVAEELRQAQLALSDLTGEVASDDLLGEIFARFCIGK